MYGGPYKMALCHTEGNILTTSFMCKTPGFAHKTRSQFRGLCLFDMDLLSMITAL